MGRKIKPETDCVEFRAVRGEGVVMVSMLKGFEIARTSLSFAEAMDMGAQLFELGEEYASRDEAAHAARIARADTRRSLRDHMAAVRAEIERTREIADAARRLLRRHETRRLVS